MKVFEGLQSIHLNLIMQQYNKMDVSFSFFAALSELLTHFFLDLTTHLFFVFIYIGQTGLSTVSSPSSYPYQGPGVGGRMHLEQVANP